MEFEPDVYINATLKPQSTQIVVLTDIANHIGQFVTVQGLVYGTKEMSNMVLVNVGGAYPNQMLTVGLKGKTKSLAASLTDKTITVTGLVINYKGKPEIIINDEKNLTVINFVGDNKQRAPSGGK